MFARYSLFWATWEELPSGLAWFLLVSRRFCVRACPSHWSGERRVMRQNVLPQKMRNCPNPKIWKMSKIKSLSLSNLNQTQTHTLSLCCCCCCWWWWWCKWDDSFVWKFSPPDYRSTSTLELDFMMTPCRVSVDAQEVDFVLSSGECLRAQFLPFKMQHHALWLSQPKAVVFRRPDKKAKR